MLGFKYKVQGEKLRVISLNNLSYTSFSKNVETSWRRGDLSHLNINKSKWLFT